MTPFLVDMTHLAEHVVATRAPPLRSTNVARARTPVLYAIGITAAYWSWLRIAAMAMAAAW